MKYAFSFLVLLVFFSCSDNNAKINEPESETSTVLAPSETETRDEETAQTTDVNFPEPQFSDNQKLIIGIWQSLDDPKSSKTFDGRQMRDLVNGKPVSESGETYIVSDKCLNKSNKGGAVEIDKYVSLLRPDQCFYIVKLNEKELEISLQGRGNTLKYRRAN